jgi:hypothetical protein
MLAGPIKVPMPAITSAINFINILCAHVLYKILVAKITKLKQNYRKLQYLLLYKKGARKMLMKLTPGVTFTKIQLTLCQFPLAKSIQTNS